MPKEVRRPAILDKFLQVRALKSKAEKWCKAREERIKNILLVSDFPDVYLQNRTKSEPDIDAMEAWCKKNLTKEELRKVYVRVIDPNAVLDLLKTGICKEKGIKYPKGLITTTPSKVIATRKVK